jgi:nucleoside-diphosphate-sugar epimerase
MIAILGSGGAIANGLFQQLSARGERIRLVSRNPQGAAGAYEVMAADLAKPDDAVKAVAGANTTFLVAGLKYDVNVWRELWPRIMKNTIEASKRAGARLVFFDNVYMYGKVNGPMTEQTPFCPVSKKGEIRAAIATMLLDAMRSGNLTAMIARAADFYGPGVRTGIPNLLVFDKLAKGGKAMWLANNSVKHSFTFTPDAARGLVHLLDDDSAWNQTWHLPTAPDPPTGREFIETAAQAFGVKPKYRVLKRPIIKLAGLFDANIRELYEMLYQNESDYLFDSSKFNKTYNYRPVSYSEGIRLSAAEYHRD